MDAERGVIFVPQGGLGEEGTQGLPHLAELDLASGLPLKSYGIIFRLPSKHVVVSSTGNAVASILEWSKKHSEISIQSLSDQEGILFDVDFLIDEIKLNDQYFFAINGARNEIHHYDVATGEHLGQIDGLTIDDWLITHGASWIIFRSVGWRALEYEHQKDLGTLFSYRMYYCLTLAQQLALMSSTQTYWCFVTINHPSLSDLHLQKIGERVLVLKARRIQQTRF